MVLDSKINFLMKIVNITSTARIAKVLDLSLLSKHLWNSIYNPKRFNAIIFRLRKPSVTILIFKTGKIVIVGAKTQEDSEAGAQKTAKVITRIVKGNIFCSEFKIQNIVVSEKFNFKPDLEAFYISKRFLCQQYDGFYPAIKCYSNKEKGNLFANLFYSGQMVISGADNMDDIIDYLNILSSVMKRFKK